jgi:hypothetical protein
MVEVIGFILFIVVVGLIYVALYDSIMEGS